MAIHTLLFSLVTALAGAQAVTVYGQAGQQPIGTSTGSATSALPSSTSAAYDTLVLNPPPLPNPLPPNQFGVQLAADAVNVNGLSIPQSGAFFGFSVEMSVVNQVIGLNGSYIHPPFLNLMALVAERAGRVHVRVGGNTQEEARMVMSLPDGKAIEKQKVDTNNPTQTPALLYTPEILYLLANISSLVNVKWYLGVPLNDTANLRLEIAQYGEQILGDNLIGLQVGNEPDLYARHQHRPETYGPFDYFGEFGNVLGAMKSMGLPRTNLLLGPSLATGDWTPEMVWDTGFIQAYSDALGALTVEHYPDDNCAALYEGFGDPVDPQTEFSKFLDHTAGWNMIGQYINSTQIAQQAGKPFIMFETNSASCGGFPGISTSFGATLWALDYGLTMASANFSHALLHVGGQNVYYNPFTAPPTNETHFHQWTIGPIFYSVLAVSETLGSSNNSRIIDLGANSGNVYTPGYAIYENEKLARLAFVNFMTDPSGANDYTVTISIDGGETGRPAATPAQIKVKYLVAPSVGEKFNITWGNQTFGGQFESDGRLKNDLHIETIQCDQAANTCQVKVPAPGFALVFMSEEAAAESEPTSTATFGTTAITKIKNTATIDEAVLATSNGNKGMEQYSGSTSFGSNAAARVTGAHPSVMALLAVAAGTVVVLRAFYRDI
ncbi:glycoside hydrolase family 79 protein [Lentinus tigrinus ALCF2SS1-6]|uniref:Glycoside hydrolase family 79 protein n=1 Tax=Lentinus tigrinus ALCF2SS1-6 TaxID=1328759 RepID=A0A5C2SJI6_9APHY|nr:glycoside hydrolase family 79 protein [Lentinus tigrinus ALCF2SS1-6]